MRRRGHIQQIGPDQWRIILSIGSGADRRRPRHTITGTRKDAERELTRRLRELDTGEYTAPSDYSVATFLTEWLENHCALHVAPKTIQEYRKRIERYVLPVIGKVPMAQLQAIHIQQVVNAAKASGKAAGTVVAIRATLSSACSVAVGWGLLSRNPAANVKAPAISRRELTIYSPGEVATLLDAAGDIMHCPLALAVYAGMRRGEVAALRWRDVDLDRRRIRVRQTMNELSGARYDLKATKTGATPVIPIVEPLMVILQEQKARQAGWKMLCAGQWDPNEWVCSWEDGGFLKPGYISHQADDVMKAAGLRHIRFHDLRHTCATWLIAAGVDTLTVSRWLGHADIRTTANIYGHVTEAMLDSAAGKLEKGLGRG